MPAIMPPAAFSNSSPPRSATRTRVAYYRAVCSFFAWLDQHRLGELADIEPLHVAAYIETLKVSAAGKPAVKEREASKPTVKQHLAAIRMLFDWLVVGQVVAINPARAVRAPKHIVRRGKTPVLIEEQACRLLASIKTLRKTRLPGDYGVDCTWMRELYPRDWPEIRRVRFERAAGVCQGCGRPHSVTVRSLPDGRWFDPSCRTWRSGRGRMARCPISSKRRKCGTPAWFWPLHTSITTRATTGSATSRACASAATCSTIARTT
jgi:hypothetical protein